MREEAKETRTLGGSHPRRHTRPAGYGGCGVSALKPEGQCGLQVDRGQGPRQRPAPPPGGQAGSFRARARACALTAALTASSLGPCRFCLEH